MNKYSFVKCSNPRHITNIYTGKEILVECGKCESCLLKKSLASSIRCKLECAVHKYTFFATLTYDNEHLPVFHLVKLQGNELLNEAENYEAYGSNGEYLGYVSFKKHLDKIMLSKKCKSYPNTFPWLRSEDCQLFIKRLRKYLSKYTDEKIRCFYCGELGPVHFRPHFHLLLWCDEDKTFERMAEAVSACWSFGRVDCQLSSGKSASYVSSYVNGNMYLPSIFKFRRTAPFAHHSKYLGESIFQGAREEIQNYDFEAASRKRFFGNGLNTECVFWRSLKTRIVPKCKGYNEKSEQERVFSYQLSEKLEKWTGEASPLFQARFVSDYVRLFDFYSPDEQFCELLQYFRKNYGRYEIDPKTEEYRYVLRSVCDYDKFERSVYVELLTSQKFIKTFCNGNANIISNRVRLLDEFYKYLDYENLKNQCKIERDFSKTADKEDLKFFFHNKFIVSELKELSSFKRFSASKKSMFHNYMKHKELNDKNLIFNYM